HELPYGSAALLENPGAEPDIIDLDDTQPAGPVMPDGLFPALLAAVQADAPEEYNFTVHPGHRCEAINTAHKLYASFTLNGVELALASKVDANAPWQWRMELRGCGYGEDIKAVSQAAEFVASGNRFEYQRGALTEWYVNGPLGLEQGFTLFEPP